MIPTLPGPWLLCAALLLVVVVVRRSPRPPVGELWLTGALTVCAAVARLVWGLWGPLHINGQGPLWIRGALEPDALLGYGPGYFELFNWVTRLGVTPDGAVFAANALLSALSPALLYAVARLAGVERGGALAAAVVLAADAVIVHTAASEGYFSSLIALLLGVQASLALAVHAELRRDRPTAVLALAAASLLAAAVARIHPMGYGPLALCPLVVLGAAQPDAWRTRVARTVAATAAIGATVLLTSGSTIITALRTSEVTGHAFTGLSPRSAELLLASLALVWCLRRWVRPPWLPLFGIGSLLLLLATQGGFQQHPFWQLCYQRLFWPGLLLGAAPLLPRRMQGLGWALGTAAVVAIVLRAPALPHLGTPTTEQVEYRFLQAVLRDMPPGCTLASVSRVGKRMWEIPSYLVPRRGPRESPYRNLEHESDLHDAVASGDCLIYVRPSLCTSAEGRALCESMEHEPGLERVTSRVFPAAPSYIDLPYDRSQVEVVVFRANPHAVATGQGRPLVSDGAAITPVFAQTLYDRLIPLQESDGCRVVRFDTSRFRITAGLQSRSGTEGALELATAPQHGGAGRRAGGWALAVPAALDRDCAVTLAAIERILKDMETPAPVGAPTDLGLTVPAVLLAFAAAGLLLAFAVCKRWLDGKTPAPGPDKGNGHHL